MKIIVTLLFCFAVAHPSIGQFRYINPVPGSGFHNPETSIILKNGNFIDRESVNDKNFIEIYGSLSGNHTWAARLSDDNKTVIVKPSPAFNYGEMVFVTVHSTLRTINGEKVEGTSFTFETRKEITPEERELFRQAAIESDEDEDTQKKPNDITYPLDSMPTYTINVNNNPAPGQIFYCNHEDDDGTGGAGTNSFSTIINNNGSIVWARDLGTGGHDFKINYNGYLTYIFERMWMVMDSNFNIVDSVQCVNGYEDETNSHDLLMYPDGHVFVMANDEQVMDLTAYGGQPNAVVTGLILQELDANRDLVFEWRSWDHFLITDANSYTPLTNSMVDYCHGNSMERDYDGNLLISCRNMNELTKIDLETGNIIWRMGGDNNQFTFVNDNIPDHFHSQHDLRRLPNGHITLYNNGNVLPVFQSSAKEYAVDEINKVATLVWYYEHPDVNGNHVYGSATGNVQRLPNGNTLIDWGTIQPDEGIPNQTEVDPNKNIVWEMTFDSSGQKSYRVHKYIWNPCSRITGYTMKSVVKSQKILLSWLPANGAKKYEVDYRALGTSAWTAQHTNRNKIYLNGLTPATSFEWKVKSICSQDGSVTSGFSVTDTFITKPLKYSMDETDTGEFLIFPVPASDHITINLNDPENSTLTIMNALGSVVYKNQITPDENITLTIDVKQWPAGIYFVELSDGIRKITKKMVVE